MNRIRECRKNKKLTLQQLSEELAKNNFKISADAIGKYERENREPKLETWMKLAEFFKVPMSYLTGVSDDKTGLKDWSDNTGWSPEQIEKERQRLINTGRLKDDEDIQHQYGYAVESLEQNVPTTTYAAISEVSSELSKIRHRIYDAFLEPAKPISKLGKFTISKSSGKVRQDMDEDVYNKLIDIINKAQTEVNLIRSKK